MIILEPQCWVSESWANLEIDSATAGMNALVQNDSSVNELGWIWNSQNKAEKSEIASLHLIIDSFFKVLTGADSSQAHPSCLDVKLHFTEEFRYSSFIRNMKFSKLSWTTIYTQNSWVSWNHKKWGCFFNIKIPTSSFCAKPWGGVAESRVNLEIDSATAGMNALVQKDSLRMLARK